MTPRFSVIVPTYQRPVQLVACLEALAAQRYPRDAYEVIVVNDGGALPPRPTLVALGQRIRLTVRTQPNQGPAAARNAGAALAGGDFLAFTDDDCAPAPGWLATLAETLQRTPGALVGGWTVNALRHSAWSEASQLLLEYINEYYNGPRDRGANFFASNNLAMSRRGFHELGGFDASFGTAAGEDRDLCARWRASGRAFAYAPAAVVHHAHALGVRGFVRQHFAYGRGAHTFRVRHTRRRGRVRVEPLAFYTALLRYPFRRAGAWRAARLAALMGLSQVANAAGFFWELGVASRHRATSDPPPVSSERAGA